jgi:aspartyl/asparaginyl-tRNA synthetase
MGEERREAPPRVLVGQLRARVGERVRVGGWVADRVGHQFVFVTDYPVSVRPFYHMRSADDPTVTSSFDLIWNGVEVTTGAQREHRPDVLVAQAAEQGVAPEPIRHYLDCFRYGCPPHGASASASAGS